MGLLTLPVFGAVVFMMYWSLVLGALLNYIQVWKLWGKRDDIFGWTHMLTRLMGIRVRKLGPHDLYREGKCLYLANHRSWADFFVDCYLNEGRAQMMSRMAVLYAFPFFMIPVSLIKGCIVFKRGSIKDKEKFNNWIDYCIESSPQDGLLVYPEGHRSAASESLPLKRGMLYYAHSRKLPVQIIMSANKESVINEKTWSAGLGRTIVTSYSRVLHTDKYDDVNQFFADLQQEWDATWRAAHEADPASLPVLDVQKSRADWHAYPAHFKAIMLGFTLIGTYAMLVGVALTAAAIRWTTGLLGPLMQQVVVALLVVWVVTAFAVAWDTRLQGPAARRRPKADNAKLSKTLTNGHAAGGS